MLEGPEVWHLGVDVRLEQGAALLVPQQLLDLVQICFALCDVRIGLVCRIKT